MFVVFARSLILKSHSQPTYTTFLFSRHNHLCGSAIHMYFYSALVAESPHSLRRCLQSDCDSSSRSCSASCLFSQSMNYLIKVLKPGLELSKAIDAPTAEQNVAAVGEVPSFVPRNSFMEELNGGSAIAQHSRTRRKSSAKSKTIFRFAHPPPKSKYQQHFHIGPRVLLQLQRLSPVSRPIPFLDVLQSSSHFPLSSIRFSKHPKGRPNHLGPDDLLIAHSPVYDETDARSETGPKHKVKGGQDVIAYVCWRKDGPGHERNAYIQMSDGAVWKAQRLSGGNYELAKEDEQVQQMVVRWVCKQRAPMQQEQQYRSDLSVEDRQDGSIFTFSIINPNARRHAIIASLDGSGIKIYDKYSTSAPFARSFSESSPRGTSRLSFHDDDSNTTQGNIQTVNEELRMLIAVSGSWVAISEGYSPYSKPNHEQGPEPGRNASKTERHRSFLIDLARSYSKSSKASELPEDPTSTSRNPMIHAASTSRIPLTRRRSEAHTKMRRNFSLGAIPAR